MDSSGTTKSGFGTILVYLDGSKEGEAVLPFVEILAQQFGSKIILLSVITVPSAVAVPGGREIEPSTSAGAVDLEIADSYLSRIEELLCEKGFSTECVTVEGDIEESINQYARAFGISLIALSGRKRGLLDRLTSRNSFKDVLSKSGIPVFFFSPLNAPNPLTKKG